MSHGGQVGFGRLLAFAALAGALARATFASLRLILKPHFRSFRNFRGRSTVRVSGVTANRDVTNPLARREAEKFWRFSMNLRVFSSEV